MLLTDESSFVQQHVSIVVPMYSSSVDIVVGILSCRLGLEKKSYDVGDHERRSLSVVLAPSVRLHQRQ